MQEATVAEQSSKIFTDVREVEITRAIANEFQLRNRKVKSIPEKNSPKTSQYHKFITKQKQFS